MKADYAPGTVAVATVRGIPNERVMQGGDGDWATSRPLSDNWWHGADVVTDVRPLVVLDLDGYDSTHSPEALRYMADKTDKGRGGNVFARIARDLADQIEAQTKPRRIPEPGLWGVVEGRFEGSDERFKFIHTEGPWIVDEDGSHAFWDDIVDPVLIREGVTA